MTTLTDRYLWAATRSVPVQQRDELRRELAERIGDDVDARVEAGTPPEAAEREALTALGDPGGVAAGYLDRPLHLIGPRYYLTWLRLLKVILAAVLPAVAFALPLAQGLAGQPLDEILLDTLGTVFAVAVNITFWTTLAFALAERYGREEPLAEWTPDHLPTGGETAPAVRRDAIGSLVLVGLVGLFVLLEDRGLPFLDDTTDVVPVFDPTVWSWLRWYLLVALLAEVSVLTVLLLRSRWSWSLAAASAVLDVVFAVPFVVLLADGRLVNPELVERYGVEGLGAMLAPGGILAVTLSLLVVAGAVVGIVDAMRNAHRADRAG